MTLQEKYDIMMSEEKTYNLADVNRLLKVLNQETINFTLLEYVEAKKTNLYELIADEVDPDNLNEYELIINDLYKNISLFEDEEEIGLK